ncbi:hypothetical protein ABW19_dt0202677 [Dactylella cylindrospora]|nr:hypothetical protein ABW19_dt0202677 [Dactylella cylindrospora]
MCRIRIRIVFEKSFTDSTIRGASKTRTCMSPNYCSSSSSSSKGCKRGVSPKRNHPAPPNIRTSLHTMLVKLVSSWCLTTLKGITKNDQSESRVGLDVPKTFKKRILVTRRGGSSTYITCN